MTDRDLPDLRRAQDGAVLTLTLDRPDARNAYSDAMVDSLVRAVDEAERDDSVRCMILTGAGPAFSAGGDLKRMLQHDGMFAGGPSELRRRYIDGIQRIPRRLALADKPIVAAINGPAAGVGLVLAAFADLRFAAAGAKFTAAHGRFNFPAEFGLSWVLPRIVGLTHANDILLSSRVFTGEEAMAMGFLNRLVAPDALMAEVMAYARTLADGVAPGSARETKRQIYRDLHRDAAASVQAAERLLEEMIKAPDYKEGVKAWSEKRKAVWTG
jgi:enoyl-CoA hydratase/carnithine racemase